MSAQTHESVTVQLPSYQSLHVQPCFGDIVLGDATAFFIEKRKHRFLVTNRHVVTGLHQDTGAVLHSKGGIPDRLKIWLPVRLAEDGREGLAWHPVVVPLQQHEQPIWIEHHVLGPSADFVLLLVDASDRFEVCPYVLENNFAPVRAAPLEHVSIVGFPYGRSGGAKFAIWSSGFVATEPDVDFDDMPVFLVDCRSREGQSGSPVICWRTGMVTQADGSVTIYDQPVSKLFGVYSGRISRESDLGRVWKLRSIENLVDAILAGEVKVTIINIP